MHVTLLLADQCSAASATMALEILSAANLFAETAGAPFEVVIASLEGVMSPRGEGRHCAWTGPPPRSREPIWC